MHALCATKLVLFVASFTSKTSSSLRKRSSRFWRRRSASSSFSDENDDDDDDDSTTNGKQRRLTNFDSAEFWVVLFHPDRWKLFCVFLFFFWLKNDSFAKDVCFLWDTHQSGCLSMMSLSRNILSIIISDDKDDNDDDTRGEKELRPPRIRAAV